MLPKVITIQKVRHSFIHLNMLSLSPGVWEWVGTPLIIFLDSLTFENAVLFSPKDYLQLAADTRMLPQRMSGSPVTSPSFFSRRLKHVKIQWKVMEFNIKVARINIFIIDIHCKM